MSYFLTGEQYLLTKKKRGGENFFEGVKKFKNKNLKKFYKK
jgi:hypothetical protein